MFKYLVSFVLLVGCGAPQTPVEVSADKMLHDFVTDCKSVYGDRCNTSMVIHSLAESAEEEACWFEDGNPVGQIVPYKGFVAQNNKTAVYELLFFCNLNLGTLEGKLLKFDEFALVLGLTKQEQQ